MQGGGGAGRRGQGFRGGGVAGVSQSGAPGVRSGFGLAVEHRRGVRNALEATGRRLGAGNGPLDGEGGSADTDPAGAHVYAKLGLDFGQEGGSEHLRGVC